MGLSANPGVWIYRALIFLVISCPCALVISIPLSFFADIGIAMGAMGSDAAIVFALAVKFACLALGAVGIANMYLAIFAMWV